MLSKCYYFGLTPREAQELDPHEMAMYIEASHQRQLDEWKFLAHVGYSAGSLGSMALAPRRPRFEEMFNFPKQQVSQIDVQASKNQLIAWAIRANRDYRKGGK